jgi:hypothetical protein
VAATAVVAVVAAVALGPVSGAGLGSLVELLVVGPKCPSSELSPAYCCYYYYLPGCCSGYWCLRCYYCCDYCRVEYSPR